MISTETRYKTIAAVSKHNSYDKISVLFQNMKNMFCYRKVLFIALGPVSKSQSLNRLLFIVRKWERLAGGKECYGLWKEGVKPVHQLFKMLLYHKLLQH